MEMVDSEISENSLGGGDSKTALTEDDELFIVDSANNALPTGMYASVNVAVYEIVYTQERQLQKGSIDVGQFVKKNKGEYTSTGKYKTFSILQ